MASIKPILIGATLSTDGGRQPYYVSGVDTVDSTPRMMWEALKASGLPQPDNAHPFAPNLKVTNVEVVEVFNDWDCRVDVVYGPSETTSGGGTEEDGTIEIDGSIAAIKTSMDIDGTPIKVIYNGAGGPLQNAPLREATSGGPSGDIGIERDQLGEVEQYVGIVTLRIVRTENSHPLLKALRFVGKVNDQPLGILGDDRDAWLCTRIAGVRNVSSDKYTVTYELQATEDGWEKVAVYIDATTGKPPAKHMGSVTLAASMPRLRGSAGIRIDTGQDRRLNGITVVRVQGRADFSTLALPQL